MDPIVSNSAPSEWNFISIWFFRDMEKVYWKDFLGRASRVNLRLEILWIDFHFELIADVRKEFGQVLRARKTFLTRREDLQSNRFVQSCMLIGKWRLNVHRFAGRKAEAQCTSICWRENRAKYQNKNFWGFQAQLKTTCPSQPYGLRCRDYRLFHMNLERYGFTIVRLYVCQGTLQYYADCRTVSQVGISYI